MDPKLASLLRIWLSATAQLFGFLWLYDQLVASIPGVNFGFFGDIFAAWALIAVFVLLHDLVVCYVFFKQEDMQSK